MVKALIAALLLLATPAGAKSLIEKMQDATMILYAQTVDGGMAQVCTATIYEETENQGRKGYYLVTASHCIAKVEGNAKTTAQTRDWFLTFDIVETPRRYYPAHSEGYGDLTAGTDFAVLHVYTEDTWPVMKIGRMAKVKAGDDVVSIAAPQGYGLQVFKGNISLLSLERVVNTTAIHWQFAMLVQLPVGNGSSGAAIVSVKQKAIIGITVGTLAGNPSTVVLPISLFRAFVRRGRGYEPGEKE